jgi:antitoxin component of MazEF toxin-antitoxin module
MPRKKKIDNAALLQAIKDNVPQNDIMEQFGFKTSTQLKVAYVNALMETEIAPSLTTGRAAKTKELSTNVCVGKRGSIIISKDLVEHLGFQIDDAFEVRKSAAGLSLKKV